jgi:hypothetical protein
VADTRPVLLGMNNPLSSEPKHALYPSPPGCTGWRIWNMLNEKTGCSKSQYLRAFDRRNLVSGRVWSRGEAAEAARVFTDEMVGREVVVLGEEPRRALGLDKLLIHPQVVFGVTWRQLPHPSGRNPWYNDADCRALAATLLAELYNSVRLPEYS